MNLRFRRLAVAAVAAASLAVGLGTISASAATRGPVLGTHGQLTAAAAASEPICNSSPGNGTCDGVQITENGPCWDSSYIVPGAVDRFTDQGYTFETDLRYSKTCQSNFSVTTLTGAPTVGLLYDFSSKVRRAAGPDGGYLMLHGGWYLATMNSGGAAVLSPLVYSPHNTAQACISIQGNDQASCTQYF